MLHILWVILKLVLILLAAVIGLVLLLLILLLFCPIRYKGTGVKQADLLKGQARASWLFHVLSGTAIYENGKLNYTIRVLGISTESYGKLGKQIGKLFGKEKTKSRSSGAISKKHPQKISNMPAKDGSLLGEEQQDGFHAESVGNQEAGSIPRKEPKRIPLWKKMFSIPEKVFRVLKKIGQSIRKMGRNIKRAGQRLEKWKHFLEDERTKQGLKLGLHEGKTLLKHMAPRKIRGEVQFGFDNPATTGQVLALVGTTCPIHKNPVDIVPVFDEKIFQGNLYVRGRIYLFMVVKSVIKLFFDDNIKFIWKAVQKEG